MSYVPEKTLNRPNIMLNEPEYGGVVAPHEKIPIPETKPVMQISRSPKSSMDILSPKA